MRSHVKVFLLHIPTQTHTKKEQEETFGYVYYLDYDDGDDFISVHLSPNSPNCTC